MGQRHFRRMLEARWAAGKFVCVDLDITFNDLPSSIREAQNIIRSLRRFNKRIVQVTGDLACAFKLNIAFYEAQGSDGLIALRETVRHIHKETPTIPVIIDANRGGAGRANWGHVESDFGYLEADAITVNPLLGLPSLEPFFSQEDKGVFVLCRTANEAADEFQNLETRQRDHLSHLHPEDNRWEHLYLKIARGVTQKHVCHGNCGLVVEATTPGEIRQIRALAPELPFLVPADGDRNENLAKAIAAGRNRQGEGLIVHSSRQIIFASQDEDFDVAARRELEKLHQRVLQCLKENA